MSFLNSLVSTTCLFLLLFALHLFFAKQGSKSQNILLSVLCMSRFGQILTTLVIYSGKLSLLSILWQGFTPLYFAAPACFYFYITGFLSERTHFRKRDWLHFLPTLLAIIHIIPWHGVTLNWSTIATELSENGYHSLRDRSGLFPAYFHYLLRPALTLSYLSLTWISVIRAKETISSANNIGLKWMLLLLKFATFFQLIGLAPIILRSLHIPFPNSLFVIINCALLLMILLYTLHQPHIFYGFFLVATDWNKKNHSSSAEIVPEETHVPGDELKPPLVIPKKLNLSEERLEYYSDLLKKIMDEESVYLNVDLQIIDLANKMNIPVHHCSFIINHHIGKNFRDWINGYRVDYFLKQYPVLIDKMTIEAIAMQAGFKNQATFYNAFKKAKGQMPTHYFLPISSP